MQDFNYQDDYQYQSENTSSEESDIVTAKQKKYGVGTIVLCCLVCIILSVASSVGAFWLLSFNNKDEDTDKNTSYSQNADNQGANININVDEQAASVVEAVATKVTPSVVGIRTTTSVESFFGNEEATGDGSGVIYRSDGYIITNYHVVSDAVISNSDSKIEVFLDSLESEPYEASVVGYNISSDIAVIKIDKKNLPVIEIADSSELKAGQFVITVGNPGGLEFMDSVTYGVISGLDRVVSSDSTVSLIQTDAAINPGNSGGALVNVKGELVGINSSKIVAEEFEGMGFAVPSNTVIDICKKIIEKENSPEPYVGITISDRYTPEVLEYYGYPVGAVVLSVADGSPAYKAGIRRGDIVTKFGDTDIEDYRDLGPLVAQCEPGEKVDVVIYRNGRNYSTTITIGSNNNIE